MPDLKRGDIVLVPVPFTDLTTTRKRPVIVISNDAYHQDTQDMLVVAMTSNPSVTPYSFVLTSADLVAGSLNRPGTVRADKIYTLSRKIAVRVFGRVGEPILQRIRTILLQIQS
jgi:mRNA interferase MazF